MTRKAWVQSNSIRDISPQGDPSSFYHPDVAAFYTTEVPDGIINGATLVEGVWTNPPPPPAPVSPTAAEIAAVSAAALAVVKADLSNQIDAAVLAIYDRPMALSKEYDAREKAAAEYKGAGYTGTVPARLSGFATPAAMPARAAADRILEKATQLRDALNLLSDLRMQKQAVHRAVTEAEARSIHAAAMASIAAIAAALDLTDAQVDDLFRVAATF